MELKSHDDLPYFDLAIHGAWLESQRHWLFQANSNTTLGFSLISLQINGDKTTGRIKAAKTDGII